MHSSAHSWRVLEAIKNVVCRVAECMGLQNLQPNLIEDTEYLVLNAVEDKEYGIHLSTKHVRQLWPYLIQNKEYKVCEAMEIMACITYGLA